MTSRPKMLRSTGSFIVRDNKLLLYRVGPANAQRQRHNAVYRDLVTGEKDRERGRSEKRHAPFHRGYWAFPYPFRDAFFYYHQYTKALPKRLRTDDEASLMEETEAALKAIRRRVRPKLIWHPGPFYSHIKPKGAVGRQLWYRYENVREWVAAARGELWTWENDRSHLLKIDQMCDELEIFVPD